MSGNIISNILQAGQASGLSALAAAASLPASVQSSLNQLPQSVQNTLTQLRNSANFSSYGAATSGANTLSADTQDMRVRLSPVSPSFYGTGTYGPYGGAPVASIMQPLIETNGVLFPYSPSINVEHSVDYSDVSLVQTNMDYLVYRRTPSVTLTITGKFTCQTQAEGQYALAAVHFFRTASLMYFGEKAGANAGLPPPILQLSGYGTYMFNNLNCTLKSHSYGYNDQIDTVQINVGAGAVRLPAVFDLTCQLTVQQTPQKMRTQFDLDAFRTGQLMAGGGGWI